VLGEYNKNSSNPASKLFEALRETAFKSHTYQHTTMGFLRDVQNMPNLYDYSLEFFKRYYRPEYTTIIVSGDVKPDSVLALVKKYWGGWKRGDYAPQIPAEPEQTEERTASVAWPWPTRARLIPKRRRTSPRSTSPQASGFRRPQTFINGWS
jgi:zinc protease